ncbi:hypothetical protein WJX74_002028 [Apatococcus lobatus]|uniref:Uncharacterized protein n=1 Tax=Apatococcus lobatus TaxID=904363 RepID=A0AAW1SAE6_9CHLO
MFAQPLTTGGPSGFTRPVIVGLVLLLLFLSMQAEWTPASRKVDVPRKRLLKTGEDLSSDMLGVRDEIVRQLSISNEKLEIENGKLLRHALDLRRAMRKCNCTGSGIDLSSDLVASGLHLLPQAQLDKSPAPQLTHESSMNHLTEGASPTLQSTAGQIRNLDASQGTSSSSRAGGEAQIDDIHQQVSMDTGIAKNLPQKDAQQQLSANARDASASRTQHEHSARRHGSQDLQLEAVTN